MLGEEFYAKEAKVRSEVAAKYCQKCGGTGLDISNPRVCKNCLGTKKRGKGNCHKCVMALAPDYKDVATGTTFGVCPDCHGHDYWQRLNEPIDHKPVAA